MIVKAYVVLASGVTGDAALTTALQDHVKREIAPYKYPRAIEFVAQLPKTETGKLQALCAAADGARPAASSAGDGRGMNVEGEWLVSTSKGPTLAVLPVTKDETSPQARRSCNRAAGRCRRDTPTAWRPTAVSW